MVLYTIVFLRRSRLARRAERSRDPQRRRLALLCADRGQREAPAGHSWIDSKRREAAC
jgi:hypothetical protein